MCHQGNIASALKTQRARKHLPRKRYGSSNICNISSVYCPKALDYKKLKIPLRLITWGKLSENIAFCIFLSAASTLNLELYCFLANVNVIASVNSRSRSLYAIARLSVVCRLSVMLMHPTQAVQIFSSFYGIRYLGHPMISTENFTEIVPGNPSAGGVKHKTGSQV